MIRGKDDNLVKNISIPEKINSPDEISSKNIHKRISDKKYSESLKPTVRQGAHRLLSLSNFDHPHNFLQLGATNVDYPRDKDVESCYKQKHSHYTQNFTTETVRGDKDINQYVLTPISDNNSIASPKNSDRKLKFDETNSFKNDEEDDDDDFELNDEDEQNIDEGVAINDQSDREESSENTALSVHVFTGTDHMNGKGFGPHKYIKLHESNKKKKPKKRVEPEAGRFTKLIDNLKSNFLPYNLIYGVARRISPVYRGSSPNIYQHSHKQKQNDLSADNKSVTDFEEEKGVTIVSPVPVDPTSGKKLLNYHHNYPILRKTVEMISSRGPPFLKDMGNSTSTLFRRRQVGEESTDHPCSTYVPFHALSPIQESLSSDGSKMGVGKGFLHPTHQQLNTSTYGAGMIHSLRPPQPRVKKLSPPWYYSQNDLLSFQQRQREHDDKHPYRPHFFHRPEQAWKASTVYKPDPPHVITGATVDDVTPPLTRLHAGDNTLRRPRFFSTPPNMLLPEGVDDFSPKSSNGGRKDTEEEDKSPTTPAAQSYFKFPFRSARGGTRRHRYLGEAYKSIVESASRRRTAKHYKRIRKRLVNKSGSCNIIHSHIPKRKQHYLSDIFTTLLDSKWRWAVTIFTLGFLLSWTLYAIIWWLLCFSHGDFDHTPDDPHWKPCVKNANSFSSLFLFSVETQHTIGYGHRYITEECPEAILVLIIQSITGAMIQGFVTGLIFSKLSRPKKRAVTLMFSKNAVICTRDGALCLLIRLGDMRRSHIVDAHTRAYLFRKKMTLEGESLPLNPYNIELGFDSGSGPDPPDPLVFSPGGATEYHPNTSINDKIFLAWPCILVHRMDDPASPFYDMSADDVRNEKYEIVVILEGMIEATGMSMQARTSYLPNEILWGYRFQKLITFIREDGDYMVDYSRFHNTLLVNMPRCSARTLKQLRDTFRQKHRAAKLHALSPLTPQSLIPALHNNNDYHEGVCPCGLHPYHQPNIHSQGLPPRFPHLTADVMEEYLKSTGLYYPRGCSSSSSNKFLHDTENNPYLMFKSKDSLAQSKLVKMSENEKIIDNSNKDKQLISKSTTSNTLSLLHQFQLPSSSTSMVPPVPQYNGPGRSPFSVELLLEAYQKLNDLMAEVKETLNDLKKQR